MREQFSKQRVAPDRDSDEFPVLNRELPFGISRDGPAPSMLDFRGHRGNSFALPYRDLLSIAHYPTTNITIEFQRHVVVVRGRNLHPVYEALMRHDVLFIQEDTFDHARENETFVDSITVKRKDEFG